MLCSLSILECILSYIFHCTPALLHSSVFDVLQPPPGVPNNCAAGLTAFCIVVDATVVQLMFLWW